MFKFLKNKLTKFNIKYSSNWIKIVIFVYHLKTTLKLIIMNAIKKSLIDLYLDYINNFLTLNGFAEYYEMTNFQAAAALDLGKEFYLEENELQLHLK